jgi:hypothetical protein
VISSSTICACRECEKACRDVRGGKTDLVDFSELLLLFVHGLEGDFLLAFEHAHAGGLFEHTKHLGWLHVEH